MKTILLDTNVLIGFHDGDVELTEAAIGVLGNYPGICDFYIHPIQFKDVDRDKNKERSKNLRTRVKQYKLLEDPPVFGIDYFERHGWNTSRENDLVDNTLLACVFEPVIEYLVTEDKGIHAKARKAGIGGRVLTVPELNELLQSNADIPQMVCIEEKPCHTVDVGDSFFDSLRKDYPGFDDWFRERCARKQRRCWKISQNNSIRAICIFKEERGDAINTAGFVPEGKTLKLCTFKVSNSIQGQKMGERLLYTAFSYARARGLDYIYLTVFEDRQPHLVRLLRDFGFESKGPCRFGDVAYGKALHETDDAHSANLEKRIYAKKYFPSFKRSDDVGKYLVPIRPEYHERLFPDISEFGRTLFGNDLEMYWSESNAIRKAYISKSGIKCIEPGDLLIFYRSKDRKEADTIAVVDDVFRSSSVTKILSVVSKRTVYQEHEIDNLLRSSKSGELLVICFDLICHFDMPITRKKLIQLGVTPNQSIRSISDEVFDRVLEVGHVS